jgi:hypothetical protein
LIFKHCPLNEAALDFESVLPMVGEVLLGYIAIQLFISAIFVAGFFAVLGSYGKYNYVLL